MSDNIEVKNENENNKKEKSKDDKKNKYDNKISKLQYSKENFKGKCEDLLGNIFDYRDYRQADQYVVTKKEIEEYIGRTYIMGADTKISLEKLEKVVLEEPPMPGKEEQDKMTKLEIYKWQKKLDMIFKREQQLDSNLKSAYSLIWGQCTELLRTKIEGVKSYKVIKEAQDAIQLLKEIKSITFKFEEQRYIHHCIYMAKKNFYTTRKKPEVSVNKFLDQFNN